MTTSRWKNFVVSGTHCCHGSLFLQTGPQDLLGARKGTEPPSSLRAIGGFLRFGSDHANPPPSEELPATGTDD